MMHSSVTRTRTLILKKKLPIVFKNQPAADTEGVLRQFITQLLKEISEHLQLSYHVIRNDETCRNNYNP